MALEETYWGYIVASPRGGRGGLFIAQALSVAVAAILAGGGVALVALGDGAVGGPLRLGLAALALLMAAPFLWYGTRGDRVEIEIDISLGEVREVVRNRAGAPSLLARHSFDKVRGLDIRSSGPDMGRLYLRIAPGKRLLELLRGPVPVLEEVAEALDAELRQVSWRDARDHDLAPLRRSGPRAARA